MMDWSAFLAMGGYAAYVWPAYGFALVVLAVNALIPRRRERALRRRIAARAARNRS
jgi:heme exporter protein D